MKKLLVALALTAAVATPAMAAELVVNGGFDLDNVAAGGYKIYSAGDTIGGGGWTVLGSGGNSGLTLSDTYAEPGVTFNAQAGPVALDLTAAGNTGPTDGVSQAIATAIGTSYRLSFYVGNATGSGGGNTPFYTLPSSVALTVGGTSLGTFTNSNITTGGVNWQRFGLNFTATGTSTLLQFNNATPGNGGTDGDNFAGLDSVSVSAVPEPASWAMMIGGLGLAGGALRRRRSMRVTFA